MTLLILACKSAWSRRGALSLAIVSIMLSVALLLTVERLRHAAHDSFAASLSGTDLVVGPRDHPLRLLLHAVFHIGTPDTGMSWDSAQRIAADPAVAWTIPLSLGDSHRGFPVVATSRAFFAHYRYGRAQPLEFAVGADTGGLFRVVLGAEVARRLGYRSGDQLALSHGGADADHHPGHGAEHGDKPFTVAGVLAPTGTPVDRALYIGLHAMEAIHLDWHGGAPIPGLALSGADLRKFDLEPKQVSAVMVGLKQRAAVLRMQRNINTGPGEALTAVIPAVALDQLWDLTGSAERVLDAISALVLAVALCGLAAAVLAGLNERRRELAILRAVGARPLHIFLLLVCEGAGLTLAGAAGGFILVQLAAVGLAPWALAHWGLAFDMARPGVSELSLLAAVASAGLVASVIPGWRAYRLSLGDGLLPRI